MSDILGLDLGTNSIGWFCVNAKNKKVIDMGIRVFPEGVNRNNKGKEISKNAKRREARQSRKQYDRKRQRKDKLIQILKQHEMFPQRKEDEANFFKINPYDIRKRGLYEKLTKFEFGRTLYHINQRMGFKSSRKSQKEKDGVVKEDTTKLQQQIKDSGCLTIGEYLAGLKPMEQRIRDRYTLRQMYEEEFELLWERQKKYYPELTEDIKEQLKDKTIFYQRPLKSVARFIGNCTLEPSKKRCRKDSFEFQRYRILEQVNRLRFIDENGVEHSFSRKPDEEFDNDIKEKRDILIGELEQKEELKFDAVRKLLKFYSNTFINLERSEKRLIGNRTEKEYSKVFGKDWFDFPQEKKDKIYQVITQSDNPDWLKEYAQKNWGLNQEKAEKLAVKIDFEEGYASLSKKAINKLLPYLKDGLSLSDAKEKAGYGNKENYRNVKEILDNLRNPIVAHTLYEMMRLMRNIERVYGKPDLIKVELARELKLPAKRRDEIRLENLKRKAENKEVRRKLEGMGIKPTGDALVTYKLWEECKEICPYTGDSIPLNAVFGDSPTFQIEHIIPYQHSLDDSYMNKTLCRIDENKNKGNRTPYEAYNRTQQYDEILKRIKVLPYAKQRRFTQKEISNDFISRQLNDTAYISKVSRELLQSLGYKAQITKGQATASLRYLWGLNNLLQKNPQGQNLKNREDHRHHTIDAAVVAMTDTDTLQRLSSYNKYDRSPSKKGFPIPWEKFREDIELFIKKMLISYRVEKRMRGALHEETYYGQIALTDNKGVPFYAVRKRLEDLTPAMIDKIADPVVKDIIKNHLRSIGINSDEGNFKIPSDAFKDKTIYMRAKKGAKIPIKKVRIHQPFKNMILLSGKTGVEPGNNHHVVLYHYKDKDGNIKQDGEICTLFEAVRRLKNGEPVIKRNLGNGKKFLFSLAINEMVLLDVDEDEIDWRNPDYCKLSHHLYRVQKISNQITFRHHLTAVLENNTGEEIGRVLKYPSSFSGIKIKIDRLGKIYKAYD